MSATVYCRFSPRPNAASCESCEKQEEDIRAYCKQKEMEIGSVYADKECSGDDSDREQLWLAIAASAKKGGILIVRNLDRLARDIILQETIIRHINRKGGKVISINGEGTDKDDENSALVRGMFGLIAEHRRKLICKLTHLGMVRNQKAGRLQTRKDGTPFGTRYDEASKTVVDEPKEKEVLAKILAWNAEGKQKEAITTLLNAEGIPAKRGGKWHKSAVHKILLREVEGRTVWKQRDREMKAMPA